MSPSESAPTRGALVAYASALGPLWGLLVGVVVAVLLVVPYSFFAILFAVPAMVICAAVGGAVAPLFVLARATLSPRTETVALPTRMKAAWWLLALGIPTAVLSFCLTIVVSSMISFSWDGPCENQSREFIDQVTSFLPPQVTCIYADGSVELVARSTLVVIAVLATVSAALLIGGLVLLAVNRTAGWGRGLVTIGCAVVAALFVGVLAAALWVAAVAPVATAVP